ncbi:hypothetical protein [Saccharopolyspora shandongensis]|uniref:hypothetical protein n=1 Tax=Saccharopolyspora shandongensis TaxID=418495 RepID=UPI0033FA34C2
MSDHVALQAELLADVAKRLREAPKPISGALEAVTTAAARWPVVSNAPIAPLRPLLAAIVVSPRGVVAGDQVVRPKV